MRHAGAILLLTLPLAGCFADQRQQLAACQLETMRLNSATANAYVVKCMEAHGYEFSPSVCLFKKEDDLYCYVPTSWFQRFTNRLDVALWNLGYRNSN
jgi:hypothetical protein